MALAALIFHTESVDSINSSFSKEDSPFEGFLKVYSEGKDDIIEENEDMLPVLEENDPLNYFRITATESFTRPPARYAEASLVRKMEELGIGRPSTYASTITTIQKRGYIEKENREGIERVTKIINLEDNKIVESEKKSTLIF